MKKLLSCMTLAAALMHVQVQAEHGDWMTSLPKALAKAQKENKLVLMDFTGSDWCPPCKLLDKEVFSTDKFNDYAKKNLVLVEVDFPRTKEQSAELKAANEKLSERFAIRGFPTTILLNTKGKELGRDVGYGGAGVDAFLAKIESYKKKDSE